MSDPRQLHISDFTYGLPDDRIPRYPAAQRDQSKLLVYKNGNIDDHFFHQLPDFLPAKSLLVFNESKVIPARLVFKNQKNQEIEVFCLEPESGNYQRGLSGTSSVIWRCLTGGLKKWKSGEALFLENENVKITAVLKQRESSTQLVEFKWEPAALTFSDIIESLGELPIPPYLTRASEEVDKDRYQTVYSKIKGSVAAPTAGLHFTPLLLEKIRQGGIQTSALILHVGAGTFKPVKAELLADHEMHSEWMRIDRALLAQLINTQGRSVIAVGTTSLRAIESLYWLGVKVHRQPTIRVSELLVEQWDAYELPDKLTVADSLQTLQTWLDVQGAEQVLVQTRILIAPPYKLKVAAGLITNFHQPNSTLLLLVSAIVGDKWKKIYAHALDNQYRFLSYGDSSLLLPSAV